MFSNIFDIYDERDWPIRNRLASSKVTVLDYEKGSLAFSKSDILQRRNDSKYSSEDSNPEREPFDITKMTIPLHRPTGVEAWIYAGLFMICSVLCFVLAFRFFAVPHRFLINVSGVIIFIFSFLLLVQSLSLLPG
jgi:hypothetical protein